MLSVVAMLQGLEFLRDLVSALLDPAHRCVRRVRAAVNLAVDGEVAAIVAASAILHEGTHVREACLSWLSLWERLELLLASIPLYVLTIIHVRPFRIHRRLRLLYVRLLPESVLSKLLSKQ